MLGIDAGLQGGKAEKCASKVKNRKSKLTNIFTFYVLFLYISLLDPVVLQCSLCFYSTPLMNKNYLTNIQTDTHYKPMRILS